MLATRVQAPYLEALTQYVAAGVLPFHTPGHQQGRGAPPALRELLGAALAADITQVLGMDDIHHPHGVTGEAQRLAARAYGADHTYFLVNGSTAGVQAMLLAALRPGDRVLVPRTAHRSVMAGLVLADAVPIYYQTPSRDGLYQAAHVSLLEPVVRAHPEARALLFTSPTYYGSVADCRSLVGLAHAHGMVALADEAWGPHLAFHPDLPESAVAAGADLVVHSTHKLLSGLTQASMLHLRGGRVDRSRLEAALRMLLSTSPSCLLLASLDAARAQMEEHGHGLLTRLLGLSRHLREGLAQVPGVRVHAGDDPTRLVFRVAGYSGYEVERHLRERHGIQLEMVERRHAVVLLGWSHTELQLERLVEAVRELPARSELPEQPLPSLQAPMRLTPRAAFDAPRERVLLEDSRGRISAETIGVYPPGIPLVCAGEEITEEVWAELLTERAAGAALQGGQDPHLREIDVIAEA